MIEKNTPQKKVIFEKITGDNNQIKLLYTLLKSRKHNISHQYIPSLSKHSVFVKSHPYRAWYLLKCNEKYIGTAYLLRNNSIGFSSIKEESWVLRQTLKFIQCTFKPLKEIKSIRPPYFYINIPISNAKLIRHMNKSPAKKIQISYALKTEKN